jgi:predicted TIM-barrel fold metal-dependent hydrolase
VRARLKHPVIDTDVHTIEYPPLLEQYIEKYGGSKVVDEYRKHLERGLNTTAHEWYQSSDQERRDNRTFRPPFWALPTKNTRDLATVSIPRLLHERLSEQGTDFAVLYPNISLFPLHTSRDDLRRVLTRAVNHYHADIYRPYRDRLSPVASIPLNTPQEGIEELEFAVKELGLNTLLIPGAIHRPIKSVADKYPSQHHPAVARHAYWLDFFGLDSEYDYDPFWAKTIELGVNPTTHTGSQGWSGRSSISSYMNNHIGHFADASEALAKALFFGGVTRRFPKLRVAFLEGGGAWGANVYTHIVDRFIKRGPEGLQNYIPANLDADELWRLFREYGEELTRGHELTVEEVRANAHGVITATRVQDQKPEWTNDFAAAGIEKIEDIRDRWVPNFYFGNEADDRTVAAAFNTKVNPLGVKVNALWSSDSGHWDVPDITDVLADSWDLVEEGVITADDFEALVYRNPYSFYTANNPDFFKGTAVEEALKKG